MFYLKYNDLMNKRVIFDLFLFLSIFIMPWWFNLAILLIGIFIFDNFYEFIFFTIVIYSIYFIPQEGFISKIIFPLSVVSFYFFFQFFKNNLFVYKK